MVEKTKKYKERFEQLTELISNPEVLADINQWKKYCKERSDLEEIVVKHDELVKNTKEIANLEKDYAVEEDKEMKEMLKEELHNCKNRLVELEDEIKILLLPKDENDESNVIIEIRGGAGGDEAALFANVLFNMYRRYAELKRWEVEVTEISETDIGGLKEVCFMIKGKGAFSKLKFESGVHRVQRVPETETQGRVHTSTVTVAVLPEVKDVDFEINDKDLKVDTYRASGAGGQHVNKTDSAIRITHLPTGLVVACQDERSQIKNRDKANKILKSKLYEYYKTQNDKEYAENRKSQVGTGDRSERIRTYNYPQGRVTDHRINYTTHSLNAFLQGEIEELIEELLRADQKAKLEAAMQ